MPLGPSRGFYARGFLHSRGIAGIARCRWPRACRAEPAHPRLKGSVVLRLGGDATVSATTTVHIDRGIGAVSSQGGQAGPVTRVETSVGTILSGASDPLVPVRRLPGDDHRKVRPVRGIASHRHGGDHTWADRIHRRRIQRPPGVLHTRGGTRHGNGTCCDQVSFHPSST